MNFHSPAEGGQKQFYGVTYVCGTWRWNLGATSCHVSTRSTLLHLWNPERTQLDTKIARRPGNWGLSVVRNWTVCYPQLCWWKLLQVLLHNNFALWPQKDQRGADAWIMGHQRLCISLQNNWYPVPESVFSGCILCPEGAKFSCSFCGIISGEWRRKYAHFQWKSSKFLWFWLFAR